MSAPSLDIILVNWNAGPLLRQCLETLAQYPPVSVHLQRVVVVDNASSDDSLHGLAELPLPLILLQNSTNQGFATGCNQGAQDSQADFLLFLNIDTRLLPGVLDRAVGFLTQPEHESIGILGVQLLDEHGQVTQSCRRFPTPTRLLTRSLGLTVLWPRRFPGPTMADWDHRDSRVVDQVMGAFYLVRRDLFERLGGYDERFFVYYEEVDFAFRTHQAGYVSFYLAEVQVIHHGWGTTDQIKSRRIAYNLHSRILYGFKHFHPLSAWGLLILTLTVEPLMRLFQVLIQQRSLTTIAEILRAYLLLWRRLLNGLLQQAH